MRLIWFAALSVVVARMFLPAALNAALPTPEDAPKHPSLAGQLLIASPEMGDPRFYHTVILMVRHDQNGAFGIIIIIDRSQTGRFQASWRHWAKGKRRSWVASASSQAAPSSRDWASCFTAPTIIPPRPSPSTFAGP